jgi:phenylpropionate dioxygenase-like ring-hydroxylating dioxygenase large terminal subunit
MVDVAPTSDDLWLAFEYFWHPVGTVAELQRAGGVMPVRLLGRDLVVARLDAGTVAVMIDRCLHRSTRLSVGCVDRGALRCSYHGWLWDRDGRCIEIPSAPGLPVPDRFRQESFKATVEHGLVWVRPRAGVPSLVPPLPAAADPAMRIAAGEPYTWPTGAARRVENFVDLAHFAWVHDGTLGNRGEPMPPDVAVERAGGELQFSFVPPSLASQRVAALVGPSSYRMPMPLTVNIEFAIAGQPGVRRHLWMTAAPVDRELCRTYWSVARNDGHDRPDEEFLAFQRIVLGEDESVVCNQVPAELPLEPGAELHVKADKVSVEYRRWLRELASATRSGPAALSRAIGVDLATEMTCAT